MKVLRICFVNIPAHHIFDQLSETPTGGAEFALYEIATRLSSIYLVSIVTGDFGQSPITKIGNITFYSSVRLHRTNKLKNILLLWRALKRASADIYVKSVFGKDMFPIWLFCTLHRKKFIYGTASDNECNGENIRKSLFFGTLFKIALKHADYIITCVKYHRTLLKNNHPNITCPIQHIAHGIKITRLHKRKNEKNSILWLARCDRLKNPEIFIELARQFPHEQFVMIAAPEPKQQRFFRNIQTMAKSCQNITFIPGIPHRQTQQFFNEAKISVNTSDFEGFSMALMQSGLGETPILTLNTNPDQIITEHNLGYCADGNIERMTEQLRSLLTDKNGWNRKSENIAQYIREHHDIDKIIPQWKTLFAEIATP